MRDSAIGQRHERFARYKDGNLPIIYQVSSSNNAHAGCEKLTVVASITRILFTLQSGNNHAFWRST